MTARSADDDDIREAYEELAGDAGDEGVKKLDAVRSIAAELRDADATLPDMYETYVGGVIGRLDDKDRTTQHETLQWAADALADDTILGVQDPILDRVCAVGSGLRKAYRI